MLYKKENKMILEKEYLFKKNILGIFSLYISITMSLWLFYLPFNQNFWENRHYLSRHTTIKVLISNFYAYTYIYIYISVNMYVRVDISRKLR